MPNATCAATQHLWQHALTAVPYSVTVQVICTGISWLIPHINMYIHISLSAWSNAASRRAKLLTSGNFWLATTVLTRHSTSSMTCTLQLGVELDLRLYGAPFAVKTILNGTEWIVWMLMWKIVHTLFGEVLGGTSIFNSVTSCSNLMKSFGM